MLYTNLIKNITGSIWGKLGSVSLTHEKLVYAIKNDKICTNAIGKVHFQILKDNSIFWQKEITCLESESNTDGYRHLIYCYASCIMLTCIGHHRKNNPVRAHYKFLKLINIKEWFIHANNPILYIGNTCVHVQHVKPI